MASKSRVLVQGILVDQFHPSNSLSSPSVLVILEFLIGLRMEPLLNGVRVLDFLLV